MTDIYDGTSLTVTVTFYGEPVAVTSLSNGDKVVITSPGNTDFTLIGAPDSYEGTEFTATGAGTGTGKVGVQSAPTSATVEIWCLSTGTEIRTAENLPLNSPSTTATISVTSTENTLQDQGSKKENKRIIVKASYGSELQLTDKVDYTVLNDRRVNNH